MNKRGSGEEEVLRVILLAIAFVVVLLFVIFVTDRAKAYAGDVLCKQSIISSSAKGVPEFRCEPKYESIKRSEFGTKTPAELEKGLKRKIADKMVQCANLVSLGTLNPYKSTFEVNSEFLANVFGNYVPNFSPLPINPITTMTYETGDYYSKKDIYLLCSIFKFNGFTEDIKEIKGLNNWINTNLVPSPNKGSSPITFFTYIYKRKPTEAEANEFSLETDRYDLSREYVVAWKHTVKKKFMCLGSTEVGITIPSILGIDLNRIKFCVTQQAMIRNYAVSGPKITIEDSIVVVPYQDLVSDKNSPGELEIVMN